jgi:hypothetical protein
MRAQIAGALEKEGSARLSGPCFFHAPNAAIRACLKTPRMCECFKKRLLEDKWMRAVTDDAISFENST